MQPNYTSFYSRVLQTLYKLCLWSLIGLCLSQVITLGMLFDIGTTATMDTLNHAINTQASLVANHPFWLRLFAYPMTWTNLALYWLSHTTTHPHHTFTILLENGLLSLELSLLKLIRLLNLAPLFCLFAMVGLIDGLVQRDLRKFGGGHESSLLYHRLRSNLLLPLALTLILTLGVPFVLNPTWIVVIAAIALGTLTALTTKHFKKYL